MIDVIHLGLGAFHRAHQAVYFQDAGLKVAAVSMRKSDVADSFNALGCKYNVVSRSKSGEQVKEITAITEALFYERDVQRLLEIAKSPELKAITLTVTEKAYRNDGPQSVPARIANLLTARFDAKQGSIAIISCDNMPKNSALIKSLVLEVLKERNQLEVADWVEREVRAPNSMIDRIVPAITNEKSEITTEPFTQWVVETDRLQDILAPVGVQFVPDVRPFEIAKIRLFNGVHSALAYIGELEGIEYVHEVIEHPIYGSFVKKLQESEAIKSITNTGGIDLFAYSKTIRERIANPTLNHRCQQIAMDGSQKLQQRLIDGANSLAELNIPAPRLSMAIAIWLHYLAVSYRINDPMGAKFKELAQAVNPDEVVRTILTDEVFPRPLNEKYFAQISQAVELLRSEPLIDTLLP